MPNNDALTAEDVAELLHVSKSSVYKLVKMDELASYYVGRKLRFTMADVENYIARSRATKAREIESAMEEGASSAAAALGKAGAKRDAPSSMVTSKAAPMPNIPAQQTRMYTLSGNDIVGDMMTNYLGAIGMPINRIYEGSYDALVNLYRRQAHAGLSHLYDGDTDTYNVEAVKRLLPGVPVRIIRLVKRRQGLIVAKKNPQALRTWEDLLKPGIRLINRERGCGSRILLDEKLSAQDISAAERFRISGYDREAKSGLAMASFVARGAADAGIGVERAFRQVEGVDFIPLQDEWLDLVLVMAPELEKQTELFTKLVRMRPFREEVGNVVGYDASHMGEIIYES